MKTGNELRMARGNIDQKVVANAVGISQSALCQYESGERRPRDEIKVKLAKYYGTTVGRLFFGE